MTSYWIRQEAVPNHQVKVLYRLGRVLPVRIHSIEDNFSASTFRDGNSATSGAGGGSLVVSLGGSVPVARPTGSLNLHVVVKSGGGGGCVGEDRDVGQSILEAETHVHRSPVTDVAAAGAPGASNGLIFASRVNVVLSRSGLSFPLVVGRSIGVGQW